MEFLEFLFTFFSLIISIVLLPFSFLFGLIKLVIVGKNGTCWVFFEENVENVKDFSECLWHEISDFFVEGTWRTVLKFIFELCENTPEGKAVAVRIFKKRSFPYDNIKKAIAISDHLDKFKELIKMFLDCKYVSKNDKKYIKKYLDDVLKLVPKKGKK